MQTIRITIDAERCAKAPRGAAIICDNSDVQVAFDIAPGSGFDTTMPINAIFVTDRGAFPSIPFAGGSVVAPVFGYKDGCLVFVGLSQGNIKTSSPAKIVLQRSILGKAEGAETEPEGSGSNIPIVSSVTLDDLVQIADVEHGRRVLITLETLADVIAPVGANGHSPYIGQNGNWFEWDDEEGEFVDTETAAQGPAGADGYSPAAAVLKSGNTITITITDKTGTTSVTMTDIEDAVRYVQQSLTSEQQAQARTNIGAYSSADAASAAQQVTLALAGKADVGDLAAKADVSDIPTVTSDLYNDSGFITENDIPYIPEGSNTSPNMDGTASAGSSTNYARADHTHPSDTSKADKPADVTVTTAGAVSQACADNTIYTFTGALTSLTLTQATGAREYVVIFTTGSTAPTVTFPSGVAFPDTLTIEANKRYEVSVRDGYAVAQSWAVSA